MDEIVQTLPSTEDGKVYIFLGMAYDATHIELLNNHPVYYYSNGAIRLWTNADSSGSGSTSVTITIAVSDWSSKACTKSVTGVTASNNIVVAPSPTSFLAYGEAQIRATAQGSGTVTFACETVPTEAVMVNVLILG